MLTNLHVKNFALIEETEIEFKKGLNILTGETGAGKSIILGSINLALGAKAGAEVIGKYGESAFVELTFEVDSEKTKKLEELLVFPENGIVTVSRRVMAGKSITKVNGETMSLTLLRKVTALLMDIHGQHDQESLLNEGKHLEIVDRFAGTGLAIKKELEASYKEYKASMDRLAEFNLSEEERLSQLSFLKYEIEEIENAAIKENEDDELESLYKRIVNSKKITEEIDFVEKITSSSQESVSALVSRAIAAFSRVTDYDEKLKSVYDELLDIESLVNDFNSDLADYMDSMDFDDRLFAETENRLNVINGLKAKHGGSIEAIYRHLDNSREKLDFYNDYEERLNAAKKEFEDNKNKVLELCKKVTEIRIESGKLLEKEITKVLLELNFEQVKFEIHFEGLKEPTKDGMDRAVFMVSLNPGEEIRPLTRVASGGELSRIMLGIKSLLAGRDDIDSLIFDEIDTGISGRTAQKVSERMAVIAKKHQVICITHLPQIASMADTHFLIEKNVINESTRTGIRSLDYEEIIKELSRMLGGSEITDRVLENARELKEGAARLKAEL